MTQTVQVHALLVLISIFVPQFWCANSSEIGDAIYLWPRNLADKCPTGKAVPQDRCLSALRALVPDDRVIRNDKEDSGLNGDLQVGSWSHTPCGCFIWEDPEVDEYALLYNTYQSTCSIKAWQFNSLLLCTEAPPGGQLASIFLWPPHLKERCPIGSEVSQDRCNASANALVKHDKPIPNPTTLHVNSWSYAPCGCVIWHRAIKNDYVFLYDTGANGCVKDNSVNNNVGQIVCHAPPPCFLLCDV